MKKQNTGADIRLLFDAILIAVSYLVAYSLRFGALSNIGVLELGGNVEYYSLSEYAKYLYVFIPGYLMIYSYCKLYGVTRRRTIELWNIVKANLVGLLFIAFVLFFVKDMNISRGFIAVFFCVNLVLGLSFRYLSQSVLQFLRTKGVNLRHVIIIGYSSVARGFIDRVKNNPQWGYNIHGIIDDEMEIGFDYKDISVIGRIDELAELLETSSYDEVVVALNINDYYKLRRVVGICEKSGCHTIFIPDYNHIIPTVPVMEDMEGLPIVNIRNVPLASFTNRVIKRICDIVIGTGCIILFSIPMLIIAIAVKLTSEGPVIYKQERVGLHNKPFMMYKFRSMAVVSHGEDAYQWTGDGNADARITKIGHIIRSTSLDELPQFFNVLKGDMSLVGPRPERPFFVEKFREEIPRYMIKHQVRPGITGWAQISGFRGDTSIAKRIDCDLYYIENWTLGLDFKILFLTLFKGFKSENAR
ncbi:MAG: undecaprenyl-phosphate glucose phosphotransferase [Lachnospiraceae bacterium]|nr:undecaprenyl-phosphate glucose phosphotransferase [Lachnospiraceae bacterium]